MHRTNTAWSLFVSREEFLASPSPIHPTRTIPHPPLLPLSLPRLIRRRHIPPVIPRGLLHRKRSSLSCTLPILQQPSTLHLLHPNHIQLPILIPLSIVSEQVEHMLQTQCLASILRRHSPHERAKTKYGTTIWILCYVDDEFQAYSGRRQRPFFSRLIRRMRKHRSNRRSRRLRICCRESPRM